MPEATHFLFIDADITWDPHDILKLLMADKPIVGGIYPIKNYQWNKIGENPNFLAELLERKKKVAARQPIIKRGIYQNEYGAIQYQLCFKYVIHTE